MATVVSAVLLGGQTNATGTYTWTGAGADNKFSTAANWEGGVAPNSDGNMLVFPCVGQPLSLNNDLSVKFKGVSLPGGVSCRSKVTIDKLDFTSKAEFNKDSGSISVLAASLKVNTVTGANEEVKIVNLHSGISLGSGPIFETERLVMEGTTFSDIRATESVYVTKMSTYAPNYSGSNLRVEVDGTSGLRLGAGDYYSSIILHKDSRVNVSPSGSTAILAGKVTLKGDVYYNIAEGSKMVITGEIDGKGFALRSDESSKGTFENRSSKDNSDTSPNSNNPGVERVVEVKELKISEICQETNLPVELTKRFVIGSSEIGIFDSNCQVGIVNGNGILKGNGELIILAIADSGVVAPGNSPGRITVTRYLSMAAGTKYQAEILNSSEYDQLVVGEDFVSPDHGSNAVSIDGAILELLYLPGGEIKKGDVFTIIDNRSSTDISGTFANLPEGAEIEVSGAVFIISYKGGDGNDVVLTAQNDSVGPKAPNTGFSLLAANPAVAVAGAVAAIGALMLASRKKSGARR